MLFLPLGARAPHARCQPPHYGGLPWAWSRRAFLALSCVFFFGHCEGLQDVPQVTLTCHGFKSQQEADQAGEADPATVITVPEGHEIQKLIADGGPCKELWAMGWASEREEAGAGLVF